MRWILVVCLLFNSLSLISQRDMSPDELTFMGGQAFYTFLYRDETPENLMNFQMKPGFTYGVRYWSVWNWKNYLRYDLNVFQAGSRAIYAGNIVQWNLNYLSLGASYLRKIIDRERRNSFSIGVGPNLNISYLLRGIQTVNKLNYNLKETNAFKNWNFHTGVVVNARYFTTRSVHFSLEYRFDCSIGQIEGEDANLGQRTRNIGHIFTAGVGFRLR